MSITEAKAVHNITWNVLNISFLIIIFYLHGGDLLTIILIRTFILYLVVLFVIRLMGQSELSKMSPFQLVIIFKRIVFT